MRLKNILLNRVPKGPIRIQERDEVIRVLQIFQEELCTSVQIAEINARKVAGTEGGGSVTVTSKTAE